MAYVVTKACLGTKDRSCVEVCPVDCFYDIKSMLTIHPDECINCAACETECPVEAIYEDSSVPDDESEFTQLNEDITYGMSDDELEEARCTSKI
ncbi:UNVERIFIED_CONTAM: hypothetical protein GTU68_025293 [Idotea baltica]|nr:hypothetical protein [Idotea baltica]